MSLLVRGVPVVLALTVVVGCGSKQAEQKAAPPAADAKAVAPAAAPAGETGVPECDSYIQKYETCVNNKVPESARPMVRQAFDQARTSWKQAAATPQGKQGLSMACTQALEAAKTSMSAYGCEW
jgi:hypothetical protein